jgi:hypothetical protein
MTQSPLSRCALGLHPFGWNLFDTHVTEELYISYTMAGICFYPGLFEERYACLEALSRLYRGRMTLYGSL